MLQRAWRLIRRAAKPASRDAAAVVDAPQATLDSEASAVGLSTAEWCQRRAVSGAVYSALTTEAVDAIRSGDRGRGQATVRAADRLLTHEFDLLGSGPFVPVDPDREAREGYQPIDWYLDPVRRLRFPRGVPHRQWNLFEMRPGQADIKYPWELGRCQHWATLGQAFRLTNDDRYAMEIARELDDFVEANPMGVGVNWTCTMDVGLRAVSWAIAFDFVRTSSVLDEAFWVRAYRALFDHGVFIRNNLENTYEVTSNHFLSNLIGLQFAGAVFADLGAGAEWSAFARQSLEHEMSVQVLADGADYESSVPYHRLVTELFLGAARLADYQGAPMSIGYRARVRDMVTFLVGVLRPDGLMPQIGDADDGRLHIFEGYGATSPQDPRHLFGPAGAMFSERDWLALGGAAATWEAAWWGLGFDAPSQPHALQQGSRLFPNAGLAVARSPAAYLLITNGIVGTNGFGNHKHNDQLSFEYHRSGIPLVVDPGSYVYTSDSEARNLFRGTASHNTVCVDGAEQNDMRPEWLFRLFETARAETIAFADDAEAVDYVGLHHGYERLTDPLVHRRRFRLAKHSGDLTIVDTFTGRGRHEWRWHFHLAPDVAAEQSGDGTVTLSADGRRWRLEVPAGLELVIRPATYSPSYGIALSCLAIELATTASLDGERSWEFAITS